jgi:hypothetical protein
MNALYVPGTHERIQRLWHSWTHSMSLTLMKAFYASDTHEHTLRHWHSWTHSMSLTLINELLVPETLVNPLWNSERTANSVTLNPPLYICNSRIICPVKYKEMHYFDPSHLKLSNPSVIPVLEKKNYLRHPQAQEHEHCLLFWLKLNCCHASVRGSEHCVPRCESAFRRPALVKGQGFKRLTLSLSGQEEHRDHREESFTHQLGLKRIGSWRWLKTQVWSERRATHIAPGAAWPREGLVQPDLGGGGCSLTQLDAGADWPMHS